MRPFVFTFLSFIAFLSTACSQDNQNLVKEAEERLKTNKATISQILTDKKYDAIHPETSFLNLIEKYCKAETISIATDTIPGKKIKVIGSVQNAQGKPVGNALVYLYHTDSRGWYAANSPHVNMNEGDMRHARLFGYVRTDKDGNFELHTIKPSGYPQSDLPAHIHIHVTAEGYRNFVNEFLFDDDERLVGNIRENSVRNQFIIAKPEKAVPPFQQQFSYTIQLQKQ
jgi:protocatechuate 3,4-dioxygenase beta subunit